MEKVSLCRIFPAGIGGLYAYVFPGSDGLPAFGVCHNGTAFIALPVPHAEGPNIAADFPGLLFRSLAAAAKHYQTV